MNLIYTRTLRCFEKLTLMISNLVNNLVNLDTKNFTYIHTLQKSSDIYDKVKFSN